MKWKWERFYKKRFKLDFMAVIRLFIHCKGVEYRRQLSINKPIWSFKSIFCTCQSIIAWQLACKSWHEFNLWQLLWQHFKKKNKKKTQKNTKRKDKIIENRLNCNSTWYCNNTNSNNNNTIYNTKYKKQ